MKHLRLTTALLAPLLVLLLGGQLGGCAMSGLAGPVAEVVDDATITAGVRAAIAGDETLKVSDLGVETTQGVVQLSGFVGSADSVAAAASVARTVKGVRSIRNDLRLK